MTPWKKRSSQRSLIAPIISEVEEFISSSESFDFCFTRRSANSVAHECARFACEHVISSDWIGFCPEFLSRSLEAD